MSTRIGYCRISTEDQTSDLQVDALEEAGCSRVFADVMSGSRDDRPQLAACLDYLREGDVLVVWKLDRLGRSLKHLLQIIEELAGRRIGFVSLTENFDTTSAGGKLIFSIFGAVAEYERSLIRDRTISGLAAARRRGNVGGRPSLVDSGKLAVARQQLSAGATTQEAATSIGVSRATLYRALARDEAA